MPNTLQRYIVQMAMPAKWPLQQLTKRCGSMKTLLLMRHAKSSWKDQGLSDHDRPLNKRGVRDAPRVGNLLAEHDLCPDLIVCSTAVRARATAQAVAETCGYSGELVELPDLYHAPPGNYIEAACVVPESIGRLLAVGHNPGISEFLWHLTGAGEGFPTAALAQVELPIDAWNELTDAVRGELTNYWRPREL